MLHACAFIVLNCWTMSSFSEAEKTRLPFGPAVPDGSLIERRRLRLRLRPLLSR